MANTVYKVEEYELQDGSLVTLKPSNIATQRKGQEMINKLGEVGDEDDGINALLDIVCLVLKRQRPEFVKETVEESDDGSKTTKRETNYELMEELFDLDTVFKVIELTLGVKLNDPKLIEAAAQMAMMEQAARAQSELASQTSTSQS